MDLSDLDDVTATRHRGNIGCVELAIRENPDQEEFIRKVINHPASAGKSARFLASHRYNPETGEVEEVAGGEGIVMSPIAVGRHRRGDCKCRI